MRTIVSRVRWGMLFGMLAHAGCNLALDFEQCDADSDCEAFGENMACASDGLCMPITDESGGNPEDCLEMVCDHAINVGNVSAQNGPNANLGIGMVAGIRAAFAEANLEGGVMGRQLNLIVRDDGYEPSNTGPAMEDLIRGGPNRRVLAIVGNVGTPTSAVAVPLAKEHDVVFHGAFTGAGLLREDPPAKVTFNYRASYAQETAAIVRHVQEDRDLATRVPPQNIAVFAQGDVALAGDIDALDSFGAAGFSGVAEALSGRLSQEDIPLASYERNTANVDVAARYFINWLASEAVVEREGVARVAIIMVPTADPAANLVIALKDAVAAARNDSDPVNVPLTVEQRAKLARADLFLASVSFVGSDKLRENLLGQSASYCPGVAVSQVVPLPTGSSSGALAYQQALSNFNDIAGTSHPPGFVSFEGYLAGKLFVEGLRNAETLDTDGLVVGLESLSRVEFGIGTTLSFSINDHQASDRVFGTQLNAACDFETLEFGEG